MNFFNYVLDSDSDEDIGWSRSKDLPKSRQAVAAAAAAAKRAATSSSAGPAAKRIKLEEGVSQEVVDPKKPAAKNIVDLGDVVLKKLIRYIPLDDRIKIRCTCRTLRDLVDGQKRMVTTEIAIRRLDEAEIGLFVCVDKEEGRFVIHNKNFTWKERPLLRTVPEIRRGMVNWTRHHKTRMGRIRTAIKAMFKTSWLLRINIVQVNLSNSFIRDLMRVMRGQCIYSLDLTVQMYEHDRPDLTLLNRLPAKSISLSVRLKDREPLPHIERFMNTAIHKFKQIIIDVRQDSWKFKSSLHFRKSWEEYGINDAALMHYMNGTVANFVRLKVICRFVTKEGIFAVITQLRTRADELPSRGFCVITHREVAAGMMSGLVKMPIFGQDIRIDDGSFNFNRYQAYQTDKEHLELRMIKAEKGKLPQLAEIRYWRKGNDKDQEYFCRRADDDGHYDPYEQPKFKTRPA